MPKWCDVSWGSHSCHLVEGHDGTCDCGCCECPEGTHPWGDEEATCVGKAPYYGPETNFYSATRGKLTTLPEATRLAALTPVPDEPS